VKAPLAHVAIVLLNWNQKQDTLECLASLREVRYSSRSVIIVDNGSTDCSIPALRESFPEAQVVAEEENLGCAGGRNAGAMQALHNGADFILFLDNDTVVDPSFLDRMVEVALRNQTIGIVGPAICNHDQRDTVWTAGATVNRTTGTTHPLYHGITYDRLPTSPFEVDFVAGCALLARREVFNAIGYFDDDYFIYFEETDWCYRAQEAGFTTVVAPAARIWHKESRSLGGRNSPAKVYYMTRNQLLFITKRFPAPAKYVLLVRHASRQLLTTVLQYALPKHSAKTSERKARTLALRDFAIKRYGKQELGFLG